jgi:hypothetical protein
MLDVTVDTTDQHDAFRRALTERDIRCALALLNDRVSYRFTAIYKLVGSVLRAQYAYDRTSEYRTWLMVVPLERSFCQYAIERGEFMTSSVSEDPRLANRPYAGMPTTVSCSCARTAHPTAPSFISTWNRAALLRMRSTSCARRCRCS